MYLKKKVMEEPLTRQEEHVRSKCVNLRDACACVTVCVSVKKNGKINDSYIKHRGNIDDSGGKKQL